MPIKLSVVLLGFCIVGLSSCMEMSNQNNQPYNHYGYATYQNYNMPTLQSSYIGSDINYESGSTTEVIVPESYHVGAARSPVSFKDQDKQWVRSQNPQGYTIEVAEDEKPAKVANKLYQLPKNDRRAQVKYQQSGKEYYKGIYGSYESPEAAQKAMDLLPEDLKSGASVKNWQSIQGNLVE